MGSQLGSHKTHSVCAGPSFKSSWDLIIYNLKNWNDFALLRTLLRSIYTIHFLSFLNRKISEEWICLCSHRSSEIMLINTSDNFELIAIDT